MNSTNRSFTILTRLIESKLNGKSEVPANLRGKKGLDLLKENLSIVFSENELSYEGEFFIKGTSDGVSVLCRIDMEDEEMPKKYIFSLLDHFSILHIPNEIIEVKQEKAKEFAHVNVPQSDQKEEMPSAEDKKTSKTEQTSDSYLLKETTEKSKDEENITKKDSSVTVNTDDNTTHENMSLDKPETIFSIDQSEKKAEEPKATETDADDNRQQELDEPEKSLSKKGVEEKKKTEEKDLNSADSLEDDFIKGLHLNPFESFDSLDDLDELPVI